MCKSIVAIALFVLTTVLYSQWPASSQGSDITQESSYDPLPDDFSIDASRNKLFKDYVVAASLRKESTDSSPVVTDFAIPKDFFFPDDTTYDKSLKKQRDPSAFILDLSHYTGRSLDFSNLRIQNVRGVYVKATQGTRYKDDLFPYFWTKLGALPNNDAVSYGAYGFLTASGDGAEQGKRYVAYVMLHGGFPPAGLPPCVDFEWDRTSTNPDQWEGQPGADMLKKLKDWLTTVQALTNRTPIIYTADSFLVGHHLESQFSLFDGYPLWVADYSRSHKASEKPAVPHNRKQALWQFASDANLRSGYDGGLDASIFYGKEGDFVAQLTK
jgi:lysozyme